MHVIKHRNEISLVVSEYLIQKIPSAHGLVPMTVATLVNLQTWIHRGRMIRIMQRDNSRAPLGNTKSPGSCIGSNRYLRIYMQIRGHTTYSVLQFARSDIPPQDGLPCRECVALSLSALICRMWLAAAGRYMETPRKPVLKYYWRGITSVSPEQMLVTLENCILVLV